MKKIATIILSAVIFLSVFICGCEKSNEETVKEPETSAAEEINNTAQENINPAEEQTDDGYIDRADAIASVRILAGSGATFVSAEKGFTSDGKKAWIVKVEPITSSPEYVVDTYYIGDDFCYKQ